MPLRYASRHKWQARTSSSRSPTLIVKPSAEVLAAREDVGKLGEYVAGKVPADVHKSWFPILVTGQDSECLNKIAGPNTEVLSFRGSAKTTWLRIFLAFAIGHNPHIQNGWISYNEATAMKSSRIVKRLIESPRYQEVFPWIRPGIRWSDRDWEIDKTLAGVSALDSDFTFVSLGITGAITSNRFHLVIYDDLIKSSKQIKNPEIREQMSENYGEVIEPCVEAVPGSRQISLGTRFRGDDIHATEFIPANDWTVIEQGVIELDENGQERSAWEERFPLAKYQKLRQRRPVIFSYQWMNRIPQLEPGDMPIAPEDIQYCDIPAGLVDLTLGIDLAASEDEQGDYTTFVLAARDKERRIYILEALEFRIKGNRKKIQEVTKLWQRYRPKYGRLRVCFEKGAYQNSFEGDWIDYRRQYGITDILCEGVRVPGDKDEKLESISGVFNDKLVWLNKQRPMGRLVGQLLRTDLDHDDLADGAAIAVGQLQRRSRRPLSASN